MKTINTACLGEENGLLHLRHTGTNGVIHSYYGTTPKAEGKLITFASIVPSFTVNMVVRDESIPPYKARVVLDDDNTTAHPKLSIDELYGMAFAALVNGKPFEPVVQLSPSGAQTVNIAIQNGHLPQTVRLGDNRFLAQPILDWTARRFDIWTPFRQDMQALQAQVRDTLAARAPWEND